MLMFTRNFVYWPPADANPIVPTHATTGRIRTVSFGTVPKSRVRVGHLQDARALPKRQGGARGRAGGLYVPATSLP